MLKKVVLDGGALQRNRYLSCAPFRRLTSPRIFSQRRGFLTVRAGELEQRGVDLRGKYDADTNGAYWDRRPVLTTSRLMQIGSVLGVWYLRSILDKDESTSAARLRSSLTSLGPAFVKIGQVASSRPDVVPPLYLKELEKLQDRIPPFDDSLAFALIESELGQSVKEVFSEISEKPVAAASLGQVYRAKLRSSGVEVAIKVQRPDVVESIALDVYLLRKLAAFIRAWRKLNSNLPLLVDEWASSLFKEVDYQREASNGLRFKQLFGHMKGVYVPHMFTEWTTSKILVMEWVDGVKLRSGIESRRGSSLGNKEDLRLVDVGVRCSLEQMLEEGFYHADPHPGNLMKMQNGLLCYIDFGMMGQINKQTQQALIRATLHLVNREFEALAEDFISLGMLPPGSNRSKIIPALTGVFQAAMATGMNNLSFGDFSEKLGTTMYQYQFQIPPYYTLLVRSLTVLEGIALSSDPSYKVLGAAYPWVARRLLADRSPELRNTLRALLYKSGKFQFSRLETLLLEAIKSPGRTDTFNSELNPDAELEVELRTRPLQFLLKDEGRFVREILLEEIAKGIDAAWRLTVDDLIRNTKNNFMKSITNPSQSLSRLIWNMPTFSEQKDREQIEGLQRLTRAMQEMDVRNHQSGNSISQASNALTWIVREIQTLPQEDRDEALKIPMVLASKVSSRVLARALRTTLGSINQKPQIESRVQRRQSLSGT
eukprot:g1052.t1